MSRQVVRLSKTGNPAKRSSRTIGVLPEVRGPEKSSAAKQIHLVPCHQFIERSLPHDTTSLPRITAKTSCPHVHDGLVLSQIHSHPKKAPRFVPGCACISCTAAAIVTLNWCRRRRSCRHRHSDYGQTLSSPHTHTHTPPGSRRAVVESSKPTAVPSKND